jgi:SAM-dependent methyltransferase
MAARDQAMRRGRVRGGQWDRRLDEQHAARMRDIVVQHGWPGYALVGRQGAQAAWLLIQHAFEDRAFQRQCLALLEEAVARGDADARHLAYLTDSVRLGEGRPQVYGTQYMNGSLWPIEDREHVDERRAAIGLVPLEESIALMQRAQVRRGSRVRRPLLVRLRGLPRRAFWSLYGRFVWDHPAPSEALPLGARVTAILAAQQSAPGERVLDAGCGTGAYSLALARAGFQVTGVDYAPGMLARARARPTGAYNSAVDFRRASLDEPLPFADAAFQHAIAVSVLQTVADPIFSLGELRRVLAPGGTLVITHTPRSPLHDLPLRDHIRVRLASLDTRTPWGVALVAAKVWAERAGAVRSWTSAELRGLVQGGGLDLLACDDGPPIVVVARKPPADADLAASAS